MSPIGQFTPRWRKHRSRLSWLASGAVLGAVIASGASFASIPDSGGVIHGCYQPSSTATPLTLIIHEAA